MAPRHLSLISFVLIFFATTIEFGSAYTVFFREHNLEPDNFQTYDIVDGNPDVCYDVTSKHPIPDIEGVGLINGAEAGILVHEALNFPGYETQAPENLYAMALYEGVDNFDCIGHPDAVIRFHDPQDPQQTSLQYVDLGKTNPSLAGRYRFWKPIIATDPDWAAVLQPDYGAGYVRILSGRFRRPAYTDDNGDMLVSWRDFASYLEAWMYLTSPREGGNQSRAPNRNLVLNDLRGIANEGLNMESSDVLNFPPQSDNALSSFESGAQQAGNSQPDVKEEYLSDIQIKREDEEGIKIEEMSPFNFDARPSENIALQSNLQVGGAAMQQQNPNNNPNPDEVNIPALQAQGQSNSYAKTTAEVGTQTDSQASDFPGQGQIYIPEPRRTFSRVTGYKPVGQVVSLLRKRPELPELTTQNYIDSVRTPDTEIKRRAQDMISSLRYAPGTMEYEMEVARILSEAEEAEVRALRARVYEPLTDPSLDNETARRLVEIGNTYLLLELQNKRTEQSLLSRNLDAIEPMNPNIARTLTTEQVNSLNVDDTISYYLTTDPALLADLRAMQQAFRARELQIQQEQAQAQGQQAQGMELAEEEEEEDDNLFAEPK
ncbi:hypothetical protein TWF506_005533 [Arthrobotrys conoides]|uniref:Uncharacterized protein n=1 Tax=Arthrobotrys conoides TaxID=74498 RepID=A0AAN8NC17_9PEZI